MILYATSFAFYKVPMKQVRLVLSSLVYIGGRYNDLDHFLPKRILKKKSEVIRNVNTNLLI